MKKLYILIIALFTFNVANAQWQLTSLNEYVKCLAVSGTNIFAGKSNGVFLSNNNGASWTAVNNGLTNTLVYSIAVSGTDIFAGTQINGIFLSSNNGTSWTAVNTGIPINIRINSIVVQGSNIFAASIDSGVFLSTNNGASWAAVNNGLTNLHVNTLAVSGSNIYAGTNTALFLSSNNGTSWMAMNNGSPNTCIYSIAASGSTIFLGTLIGLFQSNNNGNSWMSVNNGFQDISTYLAISGANIFASTLSSPFHTGSDIFLSTNNGTSWTNVYAGITNAQINCFTFCGLNVFVGAENCNDWIGINPGNGVWKRPLSEMLGISETSTYQNFIIYPNPTTNILTIDLQSINDFQNSMISIYDIQGQLKLQLIIEQPQTAINISGFAKGIYIVKVNNDKNTLVSKFVKE